MTDKYRCLLRLLLISGYDALLIPAHHHRGEWLDELRELINGSSEPPCPVNTPLAKAGGFGLRLKAGSIGPSAD